MNATEENDGEDVYKKRENLENLIRKFFFLNFFLMMILYVICQRRIK